VTWFKVDDGLPASRKVLSIPRAKRCQAMGLWALAGAWCSGELTDGRLPGYMVAELGGTKALARVLIEAGLWVESGSDYVFHDWDEYQPTSEDVKLKRKKNAERLALWREKNKAGNAVGNAVTDDVSNDGETQPPTRPDPTRPDPLVKEEREPRKRGQRLPDGWLPTADVRAAMAEQFPQVNLRLAHDKFMDHWRNQPGAKGLKLDWNLTWRNWIRSEAERTPSSRINGHAPPPPAYEEAPMREPTW
jgi:hypothetical protein